MKLLTPLAFTLGLMIATGAPAQAEPVPASLVQASGRMIDAPAPAGGWLATWPGVNWSLRFQARNLGVRLNDQVNYWTVEIDGKAQQLITPEPGERVIWLRDLPPGEHLARLIKRTESPRDAAHFIGFELEGGVALPAPPRPTQQIEFIGDSYTAAMGNMSPGRACIGPEISARTDVGQGFAVLSARALGAEWQIHAKSGMGLVRNWNGGVPHETHGSHYARMVQSQATGEPSKAGGNWRPQTVVIGLGTNDFSTPTAAAEPRNAGQLEIDFLQAYRELLASLRQRYGDPRIVLISLPLGNGDKLRPLVERLLLEQGAAGHQRIYGLDWGRLRGLGCGSHPDAEDHRKMAAMLLAKLREIDQLEAP